MPSRPTQSIHPPPGRHIPCLYWVSTPGMISTLFSHSLPSPQKHHSNEQWTGNDDNDIEETLENCFSLSKIKLTNPKPNQHKHEKEINSKPEEELKIPNLKKKKKKKSIKLASIHIGRVDPIAIIYNIIYLSLSFIATKTRLEALVATSLINANVKQGLTLERLL